MAIIQPPGITAAQLATFAPRTLLRSRRLVSPSMASFTSGRTAHSIWAMEGDFDLVRLVHENDTAATYTIDKAAVAAVGQENAAGGRAAVNAAGGAVSWVPVTYNNGGADGLPPSPSGSTASSHPRLPARIAGRRWPINLTSSILVLVRNGISLMLGY